MLDPEGLVVMILFKNGGRIFSLRMGHKKLDVKKKETGRSFPRKGGDARYIYLLGLRSILRSILRPCPAPVSGPSVRPIPGPMTLSPKKSIHNTFLQTTRYQYL